MKRLLVIAAATAVAAGTGLGTTALAAAPSPARSVGHSGEIRGIVPSKAASRTAGSGGNLAYHNGPVMHTNATYAIYWVPPGRTVSSTYTSVINGFFQNVAAASGNTSNVYWSDTQYGDNQGKIAYSSSVGGSYVDTTPYPASGCTDSVAQTDICLTDAQLQAEIVKDAQTNGWTPDGTKMFFLFTAQGVGSCFDASHCAFSYYCAYHGDFNGTGGHYLYANQPYTETVPANCGSGRSPNNDQAADSTLNVTSHEHNEAITDPYGNAWYDRRGQENGDKCAWNFGPSTASNYNQAIGTGHYYLQQEWSNARSGCVLTGT